ncbi:MAG: peptidylprolyl isomerase, partial [Methylococcales bacterium]
PDQAPVTVANMLAYANIGFYDSTLFHRVINGFMVQAGSVTTSPYTVKSPTYGPIVLESNNGLSNLRGTLAMARTNVPDSASSQFFVNLVDNKFLDYTSAASPGYAVFGKVISGLSVIDSIAQQPTRILNPSYQNFPLTDIVITSIRQTLAGSSVTNTATLKVSDVEVGAQWSYSLDNGVHWLTGSGNSFEVPVGNYTASAIQVRQTDAAGNVSASVGKLTSELVVEITAPTITHFIPSDDASAVAVGSDIVLTFSEAIQAGAGNFIIYNVNHTIAKTIAVTDFSQVIIAGNTITLNPTTDLTEGGFYINSDAGVIKDLAGNSFAGISGSTGYNFTTSFLSPPQTFVSTVANESFIAVTSNDTVSYVNARAGVKVSLLSPLGQNNVASGVGIDTLGSIANLIGSGFKDTLTGNARNNVLTGGAGADVLIGGGGKDTYVVNIKATGLLEDTVTGNAGIDTIQVVGNSTNTTVAILKLAPIIENLDISGTGTSKLNLTGNALANMLTGNAGNNLLNGGIGADSLIGGAGNDSYTVDNANDVVTEKTAEGIDLINSSVSYQLSANVENLTLTGKAAINASGNADNNLLTGNAGMNSLSGNEGIDTLVGLAGNDSLNGGNGNDLLRGGAGNDRLTGGDGVDTFWFDTATNAKTNKDTLTDFVSGTDKLQFSVSVLKALGAVGQFTATDERFWSSATGLAHDATDRLIYNTTTGELSYDGNGSAKGGAVLIEVMGTATHPVVVAADMWVD